MYGNSTLTKKVKSLVNLSNPNDIHSLQSRSSH